AAPWLLDWLRNGKGTGKAKGETNGMANKKILFTVGSDKKADVTTRAIAYLQHCPAAVSGQGGHVQTFEVARAIVYGFDLGADAGYDLLAGHYNPRCSPPWTEAELRHKCADADTKPFDKPRGYLLAENLATGLPGSDCIQVKGHGDEDDIDALPMPQPAPWPKLDGEAMHGLAGEIVRAIEPETESDPVAVLGQMLVAFGNAV